MQSFSNDGKENLRKLLVLFAEGKRDEGRGFRGGGRRCDEGRCVFVEGGGAL